MGGELTDHLFSLRGRNDANIVALEIVHDHVPDGGVIVDEQDARWLVACVHGLVGSARGPTAPSLLASFLIDWPIAFMVPQNRPFRWKACNPIYGFQKRQS